MSDNPFQKAMQSESKAEIKPKQKPIEVGKTIEINLPEKKFFKSKFRESLTINYLTAEEKKSFKDLAIQMKTTQTKLLNYLVEKEWTKYQGKK